MPKVTQRAGRFLGIEPFNIVLFAVAAKRPGSSEFPVCRTQDIFVLGILFHVRADAPVLAPRQHLPGYAENRRELLFGTPVYSVSAGANAVATRLSRQRGTICSG